MVPGRLTIALLIAALAGAALAAEPLDAEMGRALFQRNWVAAPSSTGSDDGLGPLYDARSCSSCHVAGGPGRVAAVGRGSVVRIGNARGTGDPVYGTQFQISALPGIAPEGNVSIRSLAQNKLRVFALGGVNLGYGLMDTATRVALRRAPSLRGIGLLESISSREIRSRADPDDRNRDGISGRLGSGRFGWKATQTSIASQVEMALMRDIGLSTRGQRDHWGECTRAQAACRAGPGGASRGGVEVPNAMRDMIVAHLRSLPPPTPLKTASRGFEVFNVIGCGSCHANPRGPGGAPVPAYTDLLLHDLGEGLDDGIAEGNARPSEWRTAPLWDVAASVKEGGLMHDGRARNVDQAIAWHGGEAAAVRARFVALPARDKAALAAFLMRR